MRAIVFYLILFGAAFGIYHSNGPYPLGSLDSAPNSLVDFNVLSRGKADFDVMRGSDLVRHGAGYAFVESPSGHYVSMYPIGTAIVTLPLYVAFDIARRIRGEPVDIAAPAFDTVRQLDEKAAATVVAALAVVLFFICARTLTTAFAAGIATLAFGFGTEVWAIASQALWQHGPVCLALLAMILAFLRARRAADPGRQRLWVIGAGLCAGLLITIRPTAGLFALAALIFVAWRDRRRLLPFALAGAAGIAPFVIWNLVFFHNLAGGYGPNLALPADSIGAFANGLAGQLISPNRGLFIFTPLVVFSIVGAVRAARAPDDDARLILLLAGASVLLYVTYASFFGWWAGWCYGPRYLTDTMPVAGLLLVYVLPASPRAFLRRGAGAWCAAIAFTCVLVASIAVQVVGTNSGTEGPLWNATRDVGQSSWGAWDLSDPQIAWNARAMYHQFVPGTKPATR